MRAMGAEPTAVERELRDPISLCRPDGRLDPRAVGWSRHPLHRCNLRGRWGRKKRWDYWCVTTRHQVLSLTYADIDYLGLASATFVDLRDQRWLERTVVMPLALGFSQPDTVGGADIAFDRFGLSLAMREQPGGTRLTAGFRAGSGERVDADLFVALPPGHETLSVVVPWSERQFQYTSKHNTRPATGRITVDGRHHEIGPDDDGFGCLDYGRGIWPYRTDWNWASASGLRDGRAVGIQLGGQWTDGTGATENGICIGGRLSKISERVEFQYDRADFMRPWRIVTPGSDRVDLTLTPVYQRQLRGSALVLGGELHLCFGRFSGTVVDDAGRGHPIADLVGWAEEVQARW
jgi:hypothetical protein